MKISIRIIVGLSLLLLSSCIFDAVRDNADDPNAILIGTVEEYRGILSTDGDHTDFYSEAYLTIYLDDFNLVGLSSVIVQVYSDTDPTIKNITLTSPLMDGYFSGQVYVGSTANGPDQVQAYSGDFIYIEYADAAPAGIVTHEVVIFGGA